MNIAMEQTTECVDNVVRGSFGDAFIRGNNGTRAERTATDASVLYITALE